jgi:integrase
MIGSVWLDRRTRGKPTWCIRYRGPDGRKHRVRTEAQSRKEAKALLLARLGDVAKVKAAGGERAVITFGKFVEDEYLPWCQKVNTPRTYVTKRNRLLRLVELFGGMKLRDMTKADIKRYLATRYGATSAATKRTLRPASVNRELMTLSNVFREAWDRDYIDRNPCRGIRQLPEENTRDRYLTVDEEQRLMTAAAPHIRPIIITGLHTGGRLGELLRLRWGDVDFNRRQVTVRAENSKNHQSRHIPMSDTLHAVLKSMAPDDAAWGAGRPVFAHSHATEGPRSIRTGFDATCVRAGIVGVTFHTMRHTFASRLVQAGVPIFTVSRLLGHGDVKTTARYAHLGPDHGRGAVAVLDAKPVKPSTPRVQTGGRSRGAM